MKEALKKALLQIYADMEKARQKQENEGRHDQGQRGDVTSGQHLNSVLSVIRDDLIHVGFKEEEIITDGSELTLPGWFRPAKNWDMLVFSEKTLLAFIELKSINSSFGNNYNNRAEETIGSAIDVLHAIKNELIPVTYQPPMGGYVMIVKLCEDSCRTVKNPDSRYPIDKEFTDSSYFKRFSLLCRRMLAERLYQSIWLVGVDPEKRVVIEPEQDLTYEKFITSIESMLRIKKA